MGFPETSSSQHTLIQRLLPGVSITIFAFTLSFLAGCTDQGLPVDPGPDDTTGNARYDWVDNIGPLMQSRCITCHGAVVREGGFDARTYQSVINRTTTAGNPLVSPGNPEGSELVMRVEGNGFARMPQGGSLEASQISMIRAWIEDGAPENVENNGGNGGNGGGTVASDSITWENTVERILQQNCLSCHGAVTHENDFRVDSFHFVFNHVTEGNRRTIDTSNVEQSELLMRLEGNGVALMPFGGNILAESIIDSIRTWIQNGAPETDADIGIGGGRIQEPLAIDWVSSVGRILRNNCSACHSGAFPQSGLDLTNYRALFDHETAMDNSVVKKGDLEDSELFRRISADGFPQMPPPPNAALSETEIDTIRQWILNDAPFVQGIETFAGQNKYAGQPKLQRLVHKGSSR